MSGRAQRRAIERSGALTRLVEQNRALARHNSALSLFLRGVIRAYGGIGADPRLVVAKPLLDGPRDRIVATPMPDRVILSLAPDPATAAADAKGVPPTDADVPWGAS